jgi:hypothetical protein
MSDELKEYLEDNPEFNKYIVDGEIDWSSLNINIDIERTNSTYIDDTELFISATLYEDVL